MPQARGQARITTEMETRDPRSIAVSVSWLLVFVNVALAQDPTKALPRNYQLAFENELVQVIRVRYGPHEKLPVHDHSRYPTVYVYLTDSAPVRFSHVEEKPFTIIRPPVKAGGFRVSPGRIERHTVENLGDTPSEFLRVELKRFPLGIQNFAYRGYKPFDLSHTAVKTEFSDQRLTIERIVCAGRNASELIEPGNPSLLVAFSPMLVRSSGNVQLPKGDVYWLSSKQAAKVETTGRSTAHALRIVFLNRPVPMP